MLSSTRGKFMKKSDLFGSRRVTNDGVICNVLLHCFWSDNSIPMMNIELVEIICHIFDF